MPQPTPYNRLYNLTDYATANPSAPYNAAEVDAELNGLETTVDDLCTNIALIQRDDGLLKNASVHPDALSAATKALIASDWTPRGAWVTAHAYVVGDVVEQGGASYVCATAHTSGVFATDHTAGKWVVLNSASGTVFADNVFQITGSSDATKVVMFEADGLTAGATRTVTVPDADIVMAGSSGALTAGRIPFAAAGGLLTDAGTLTMTNTAASRTWQLAGSGSTQVATVVQNTHATGVAFAQVEAQGTGDAYLMLIQGAGGGVVRFHVAIDQSDSQALVIGSGATIGASNRLKITTAGAVSIPGALTVSGSAAFNGNVTVGDAVGDAFTINSNTVTWNAATTTHSGAHTFSGAVTLSSTLAANGGVTLGDAAGDSLTITSSAVSVPNGLNFDANTFVIDAANNRVIVGHTVGDVGGVAAAVSAHGVTATTARIASYHYGANATGSQLTGLKARGGTIGTPSAITSGDTTLQVAGYAYVGAAGLYVEASRIDMDTTGVLADAATGIGGRITLMTRTVGGALTNKVRIDDVDVWIRPDTATPAAGSTSARLLFGTTAAFGIYYGSGVPTVVAAKGSLYLRNDGASTTTRAYIATDSVGTWTAITTSA